MRKAAGFAVVALLLLLAPTASSLSWEGIKCGNDLISLGDSMGEVQQLCGEPHDVTVRVREVDCWRIRKMRSKHRVILQPGDACYAVDWAERYQEQLISTWHYDLGPRRFVRTFTFHDWKLVGIETGSYGTRAKR